MQSVWFHGTNKHNSVLIRKNGFRTGTWFARHMEDAIEFGGPYVFYVNVTFPGYKPYKWQVCSSNKIPAKSIKKVIVCR